MAATAAVGAIAIAASDHGNPSVKISPKCPQGRMWRMTTIQRRRLRNKSRSDWKSATVSTEYGISFTSYPCSAINLPTSRSSAGRFSIIS